MSVRVRSRAATALSLRGYNYVDWLALRHWYTPGRVALPRATEDVCRRGPRPLPSKEDRTVRTIRSPVQHAIEYTTTLRLSCFFLFLSAPRSSLAYPRPDSLRTSAFFVFLLFPLLFSFLIFLIVRSVNNRGRSSRVQEVPTSYLTVRIFSGCRTRLLPPTCHLP